MSQLSYSNNNYSRVKMKSVVRIVGQRGSDGVWYEMQVFSDYPTITGYKLKDGTWMLDS